MFNAVKRLWNIIKSGIALLKMPLAGWALVLVAAFVIYSVATDYRAIRNAINYMQSVFSSPKSQVSALPAIKTSVTKDDPEWMWKYCREQAALLPPAPFKYEKKETWEKEKWIPIPPRYVASRMPKDAKGNKPDSMSCGIVYKYDEKEAFASLGVAYKFDINAFNEFYQHADNVHTDVMDAAWKKISPLNREETGRSYYSYEGYPLLFMRENSALGTMEYADMSFAVDYYVIFTVYEKPK